MFLEVFWKLMNECRKTDRSDWSGGEKERVDVNCGDCDGAERNGPNQNELDDVHEPEHDVNGGNFRGNLCYSNSKLCCS